MTEHPFDPTYEELPKIVPIFPLNGALLLPRGHLPLNIFEPRYLNMVRDALSGDRVIGMIQPKAVAEDQGRADTYQVGCTGRIAAFSETDDGRYLITLRGLLRFELERELPPIEGYRRVVPDYSRFREDLVAEDSDLDRDRLLKALHRYFEVSGIAIDWENVEQMTGDQLVNTMAMVCPFEPPEKQALLEAAGLAERAEALTAILEMSALDRDDDVARH